jgi:hypothetical protein
MKGLGRILKSTIALIISLAFCALTVFAWFTNNSHVGSNLDAGLVSADISEFSVSAYYLNGDKSGYTKAVAFGGNKDENGRNITSGGVNISVDKNGDGRLASQDNMRPYGIGGSATAVLFVINYVALTTDKSYTITASGNADLMVNSSGGTNFYSYLSNAVNFVAASVIYSGGKAIYVPQSGTPCGFLYNDGSGYEKNESINIVNSLPSGTGTAYIIMDYDAQAFAYLYALILQSDGDLNAQLSLNGDIVIGIQEEDSSGSVYVPQSHSYALTMAEIVGVEENAAITSADLVGSNEFLSPAGGSVIYRTSGSGAYLQIRDNSLSVTFLGTGTLVVGISSTGSVNTSAFGLINEFGNIIDGSTSANTFTEQDADCVVGGNSHVGLYRIYGTNTTIIEYNITRAGTYTLSGTYYTVNGSRGCNLKLLEMVDKY